jgi:2-polyprenyl-3-methyl-5-hydroxy-6-metoxy-1,4-benzoquinol methylase
MNVCIRVAGSSKIAVKTLDRILQLWRIAKVRPYVSKGVRVLDVGCADGALFRQLKSYITEGVGIDPDLARPVEMDHCKFVSGGFPQDLPETRPFDAITMLAVLEHIPADQQPRWATACARLLKPGGYLVITTPSAMVDPILSVLKSIRLIDGMSLEEHYGFDPRCVPSVFSVGKMKLVKAKKFQLGFNNLYVFQKIHG